MGARVFPSPNLACALCGDACGAWGNNPDPLGDVEQRVCDWCNGTFVVPARLGVFTSAQVRALRSIINVNALAEHAAEIDRDAGR